MKLLVAGDFHFSKYFDKRTLSHFLYAAKTLKPDKIILLGDVFDFYQISKFDKSPKRLTKLQDEIDEMIESLFVPLSRTKTKIDYILGNHEQRLQKYLNSNSPALASLKCLSLSKLFSLDKFGIDSPRLFRMYERNFFATHGTFYGKHAPSSELTRWGMSGISAHVHKTLYVSRKTLKGSLSWLTVGAMCRVDVSSHTPAGKTDWTQSFALITLKNGLPFYHIYEIKNGVCLIKE